MEFEDAKAALDQGKKIGYEHEGYVRTFELVNVEGKECVRRYRADVEDSFQIVDRETHAFGPKSIREKDWFVY